jgi:Domain of unknown function (DUF4395)
MFAIEHSSMVGQPAISPASARFSDQTGVRPIRGALSTRRKEALSGETRPGKLEFVQGLFSFPNPVNEKAARVVAGAVLVTAIAILATGFYWLLIPLAYGFWARVLTGPTLSPLGTLAQKVIAPRLGASKPVPGPPKRFAQGMGVVFSTTALALALGFGAHTAADMVIALLAVAAGLESIFAVCLGCQVFAVLMRVGVIPSAVCAECADVGLRLRSAAQ